MVVLRAEPQLARPHRSPVAVVAAAAVSAVVDRRSLLGAGARAQRNRSYLEAETGEAGRSLLARCTVGRWVVPRSARCSGRYGIRSCHMHHTCKGTKNREKNVKNSK